MFVGDRGMITEARIKVLKEQGVGFITALRAPQIQALTVAPDFQLSLFDERGLCEVSSPQFKGERLVICRNPAVAAERARKREELLERTEQDLAKVKQMVEGERGKLKDASAGKIGERAGRVVNRRKMAKHFTLQIADGSFSYQRNQAQIDQEALFDGIYVIRTAEPQRRIGSRAVVRAYKQLKVNERAFRTMKTPLEIRPIYHRLEDRVRAHAFICMLGCYVEFELARRLAPLLFKDDTPLSAADPVAPAITLPTGRREGRQRPDRRRTGRAQPRGSALRPRHAVPQRRADRRGQAHLPAPDNGDRAAGQRLRTARHQAQVDRRQPARNRENPAIPG